MIVHVVLFEPRPDLPAGDRQQVLADLRTAASRIPGIQRFRIGRRTRHGLPGYEQAMPDSYEYAVLIEFADVDALRGYLAHPAHEAVGRHFTASAARALAYDFEMVDAAAADAGLLLR